MIRSALLLALLAAAPSLAADPPPAETGKDAKPQAPAAKPGTDTSIDSYKMPVETIDERVVGSASQPVRFNWRRIAVAPGITGSSLLELNNFASTRAGLMVRRPVFGLMGELAASRVWTTSTPSSDMLSLTPYRQAGRPRRWELDVNASFPLAEGVVTAWPAWLPSSQLVLWATGGVRYLLYPGSVSGMSFFDASRTLISPYLSDAEVQNLEGLRNPGMQIDRARYSLLLGLSTDLYFHQGLFFCPRVLLGIPVLSGIGDNGVGFWWELTFGMGWAF